jgi:uncharacterized protein YbjQ (UPF0145 family)
MNDQPQTAGLPMSTTFELPGMKVRDNLGVCYGLVVRSMGVIGGVAAGFKALRRGEVSQYTQLLEDSRRFDSSEIGQQMTEIVAYGTAVTVDRTG